uniref:Uncharacterized protein n=1 Tax=Arundo donax TaxID=35708 RepID=A0A0A9AHP8_ARUDO
MGGDADSKHSLTRQYNNHRFQGSEKNMIAKSYQYAIANKSYTEATKF